MKEFKKTRSLRAMFHLMAQQTRAMVALEWEARDVPPELVSPLVALQLEIASVEVWFRSEHPCGEWMVFITHSETSGRRCGSEGSTLREALSGAIDEVKAERKPQGRSA